MTPSLPYQIKSISFEQRMFGLANDVDARPGLLHDFCFFGLLYRNHFSSPVTIRCKNFFLLCRARSWLEVTNRLSTSLGWVHTAPIYLAFKSFPWLSDAMSWFVMSLPMIQRALLEFDMGLRPIMSPIPRPWTSKAFLHVLCLRRQNHQFWIVETTTQRF